MALRPPFRVVCLACGLLSISSAHAASPLIPSLQLTVASAHGDFRDDIGSRVGLGAGLSFTFPLTSHLDLRPSLAFQTFPTLVSHYSYKSTRFSDRGEEDTRWSAWTYGADCIYRPGGGFGGLYTLVGANVKVWRLRSWGSYVTQDQLSGTRNYVLDDTSTKNEPALAMGLGYTFNRHFSLEARSVFSSFRSLSFNTLECSLVLNY